MPIVTYNTYSEVDTHSIAAGGNSYQEGAQNPNLSYGGTPDEFYGTVTGTGSSATIDPFTRSNYFLDNNGNQIYLFEPSYGSNSLSNNNEDICMQMGGSFLTKPPYPSNEIWIRTACIPQNIQPSGWTSPGVANNPIQFYLKLFDTTSQGQTTEHNVCLEFSGGSMQLGGKLYYTMDFVSPANEPVCLTDTCDVLTPNGYVNVKDLSVGDLVTTPEGENVKITKVMKPTTHVAMGKALPHFIPKNSLGENKPTKDTFISKNHAYNSGIPSKGWLCGQFNIGHNATNWDKDFVTYYNIMTEDYPKHTLVVNGVEMESWGGYEHNKPETHGNIKLRKEKLGFD